jgi:hypothetical protein
MYIMKPDSVISHMESDLQETWLKQQQANTATVVSLTKDYLGLYQS